ncbi:MAG: hypothetical protein RLZ47_1468 [Bacteroidota bacterium]|jgi:putative effector of murein hydrolase LrgA (UPF0299 family)
MTTTSKILATAGIILLFLVFSAAIQAGAGPGGRNPGIIGIVLLFGLIAGIRAIWKKPNDDNSSNTTLNKN